MKDKEHYPVEAGEFKPQNTWGSDCHCPEPEVSEDGEKCVQCGGTNPVIFIKSKRQRKGGKRK